MTTSASNIINTASNAASSATTNTSSTASSSSSNAATNAQQQQSLNSNYQDFLKLLTTQLQHQDPTNPANTDQLTQEIASLSLVQGQLQMNNEVTQLISLFSQSQTNNAVSYIGKQIDATGSQFALTNGTGTLNYTLPAGTSSATITITNSAGAQIFSGPATTVAGRNAVSWNGLGSNGQKEPDGIYNFSVVAKDAGGKTLAATTLISGVVQSVDSSSSGAFTLNLGGNSSTPLEVPPGNVQSVYDAPANSGA